MEAFMETTKQEGHARELKRLADNHELFKDSMGGLLLAPVDLSTPGLRILDSATADGLWLRDVATTAGGSHRYFGTDIVPDLFPSQLPRNMTLQEQDFTKPWPPSWRSSFDLVHQRLGLAGAGSCPLQVVVKNLVELAKPGGWLELVELDLDVADGQGPALRDFLRLLKELFTLGGMGGNFAVKLRGLLEEAGLENVEERVVEIPAGARNTNPNLAARSINGVCGALEPLIAVAKRIPTSFTEEQLVNLGPRIKDELTKDGGLERIVVVWGQKHVDTRD